MTYPVVNVFGIDVPKLQPKNGLFSGPISRHFPLESQVIANDANRGMFLTRLLGKKSLRYEDTRLRVSWAYCSYFP